MSLPTVEQLQEALNVWDETIGPTESLLPNTTKVIVDTARAVLEAPEIQWCEVHQAAGSWSDECDRWVPNQDCRMVSARLLMEQ